MTIATQNPVNSGWVGGATDASVSHTVPAGTKKLIIIGAGDSTNSAVPTPTKCSWNGVNATLKGSVAVDGGGTGYLLYAYEIDTPTPATGNVLFQINSVIAKSVSAVSITATNAVTSVYGTVNYATSLSASATVSSVSGHTAISALAVNNKLVTEVTETSGQTVLVEIGDAGFGYLGVDSSTSAGSSVTSTWTITAGGTGTQRWAALVIDLVESTGTFDSLNSGTIKIGEQSVTYATTTLGTPISAISTTGLALTSVSGGNSGTANVPDFSEGVFYPDAPTTATFTAVGSSSSADIAGINIALKTSQVRQTVNNPITNDPKILGYWMAAAGHTPVNGDRLYYIPVNNAVVSPATEITIDNAGTFSVWQRVAADGKMYEYVVTVNDSGQVVSVGLTSLGLTTAGLTTLGLTRSGLA